MRLIDTAEHARLDAAVAKALGLPWRGGVRAYSTDWAIGGPLIESEQIEIYFDHSDEKWRAQMYCDLSTGETLAFGSGPTPLIAAMICYVAARKEKS